MRMPSSSARFARPVRTFASSRLSASIALLSPPSRSWRTSFTMASLVGGDERADGLAHDHLPDVAPLPQIEHDDREAVVAAQRDRRGVHHLEVALEDVEVREPVEAARVGVLLRVAVVDAVDP